MTTYSLAEVRNGTGWPSGARFQLVGGNIATVYSLSQIRCGTGWPIDARFTLVGEVKQANTFDGNMEDLADLLRGQFLEAVEAEFDAAGLMSEDFDADTRELITGWLVDVVAPTLLAQHFDILAREFGAQLERCITAQVLGRLERDLTDDD